MSFLPATVMSLLGHGLLILFVLFGWQLSSPPEPIKPPSYIKATLMEMKAQSQPVAPKPAVEPKPEPPAPPPAPEPDREVEKQQQERARQEEIAKQKQIALEKAEKEKAEKARKEKERREKEKKEKEEKEAEKRKQEQLRKEREQAAKQKLQDELQAELAAERDAQQAVEDSQRAQSYANAIGKQVEQNWSRPPSARNGMQAELLITLIPTGEVIDVQVAKSSGNGAFDRSAVQAVKRAGQFDVVKQMPSGLFERNFRQLRLLFKPQDLRQ